MKKSKKAVQIFSVMVLVLSLFFSPAIAAAAVELATTYPGIAAGSGEVVTFPLEIVNNGSQSRVVTLQVEALPEGWHASIEGKGRQVNQVYVFANSEADADLKVHAAGVADRQGDRVRAGDRVGVGRLLADRRREIVHPIAPIPVVAGDGATAAVRRRCRRVDRNGHVADGDRERGRIRSIAWIAVVGAIVRLKPVHGRRRRTSQVDAAAKDVAHDRGHEAEGPRHAYGHGVAGAVAARS